jgi:hypothetical protein
MNPRLGHANPESGESAYRTEAALRYVNKLVTDILVEAGFAEGKVALNNSRNSLVGVNPIDWTLMGSR